MAISIADVLEKGGTMLLESPCGTGKTLAALIPVFLLHQQTGKTVMLSTSTITLQDQLQREAEKLSVLFGDARVVRLLGKSRYLCMKQATMAVADGLLSPEAVRQINDLRDKNGEFHRGYKGPVQDEFADFNCDYPFCENYRCPNIGECFYFGSRRQAKQAAVVIVNHALLFNELRSSGGEETGIYASVAGILLDEAHRLPDYLTSAFTDRLRRSSFYQLAFMGEQLASRIKDRDLSDTIYPLLHQLTRQLPEIAELFFAEVEAKHVRRVERFSLSHKEQQRLFKDPAMRAVLNLIRDCLEELLPLADVDTDDGRIIQQYALRLEGTLGVMEELIISSGNRFPWLSMGSNGGTERIFNLSPVRIDSYFQDFLSCQERGTILLSGTLGYQDRFDYFKSILNLRDTIDLTFYSDYEKSLKRLFYVADDLPSPREEGYHAGLVTRTEELLNLLTGRVLILFTSLSLMRSLASELQVPLHLSDRRVLVQGELSRSEIMDVFSNEENSVLFASVSYWEGLDLREKRLQALVLTRLPFDVPDDPIIRARFETHQADGGDAFQDLALPSAVLKLKQGVGRLIRHPDARGVVAILDSRILTRRYGRAFLDSFHAGEPVTALSDICAFLEEKS
jgi:ATP-dependent DNA helicase DinG